MPAEHQASRFCADYWGIFNVHSDTGEPGLFYTVTMNGGEGVADCTCPAFKFSGAARHCKHIDHVFQNGCFWNPQWKEEGGPKNMEPYDYCKAPDEDLDPCPRCGGPVVAVVIAV